MTNLTSESFLIPITIGKGGSRISQYNCSDQADSGICEVWSKDLSDYSYALAFFNSVSKREYLYHIIVGNFGEH